MIHILGTPHIQHLPFKVWMEVKAGDRVSIRAVRMIAMTMDKGFDIPSSSSCRHSKVTSKVKGLVKAVGLSRTTMLVTFTRAMMADADTFLPNT